jgi:hypothetical protein
MAIKQVDPGHWYSTLAEQSYDSELAAKYYDDLERQKSQPESAGSKILDKLSAEEIKSLYIEMANRADQPARAMAWQEAQIEFCASHPDFLACPHNGSALVAVLTERGMLASDGTFTGTQADIEQAVYDLAERNVLLRKEKTPLPKRPFNAAEAYEMSYEELRKRAQENFQ